MTPELKLKCAKELPEHIRAVEYFDAEPGYWTFYWIEDGEEIKEREWDWIVNHIVSKLNEHDACEYTQNLLGIDMWSAWHSLIATAQQRAEAYFKMKGGDVK